MTETAAGLSSPRFRSDRGVEEGQTSAVQMTMPDRAGESSVQAHNNPPPGNKTRVRLQPSTVAVVLIYIVGERQHRLE